MSRDAELLLTLAETLDVEAALSRCGLNRDDLRAALTRAAAVLGPRGPDSSLSSLTIHVDGACRGNPGPSGAGVVIYAGGRMLEGVAQYLGRITNNQAEYNALIIGLKRARELKASKVSVKSDSELMVHQMNGVYQVKSPRIKGLHHAAAELARGFESFEIAHVPRERNQAADAMANRAIDEFENDG